MPTTASISYPSTQCPAIATMWRAMLLVALLAGGVEAQSGLVRGPEIPVVRGDTLIRSSPGRMGLEMRFLVLPDSVLAISVGGLPARQPVRSPEAELIRFEAAYYAAGGSVDSAVAADLVDQLLTRLGDAPAGFEAVRALNNGDSLFMRGDTIRVRRSGGQGASDVVITLSGGTAVLHTAAGMRQLSKEAAAVLALLRYRESALVDIDALLGSIPPGPSPPEPRP
jgi:hypothetical protein